LWWCSVTKAASAEILRAIRSWITAWFAAANRPARRIESQYSCPSSEESSSQASFFASPSRPGLRSSATFE
jgi:hypothetical protein